MPYLAHLDTDKIERAEQAAAYLESLNQYWANDTRVQVSQLVADLRQELTNRKPAWHPEAVTLEGSHAEAGTRLPVALGLRPG